MFYLRNFHIYSIVLFQMFKCDLSHDCSQTHRDFEKIFNYTYKASLHFIMHRKQFSQNSNKYEQVERVRDDYD